MQLTQSDLSLALLNRWRKSIIIYLKDSKLLTNQLLFPVQVNATVLLKGYSSKRPPSNLKHVLRFKELKSIFRQAYHWKLYRFCLKVYTAQSCYRENNRGGDQLGRRHYIFAVGTNSKSNFCAANFKVSDRNLWQHFKIIIFKHKMEWSGVLVMLVSL